MRVDDDMKRALACIAPDRLAKASAARLRHERRQARLQRLAAERERQRQALLQDPVTRALAKANATAARSGDDSE
jgi:hypothetical protein